MPRPSFVTKTTGRNLTTRIATATGTTTATTNAAAAAPCATATNHNRNHQYTSFVDAVFALTIFTRPLLWKI